MNAPRIREGENRENVLVVALDVIPLAATNANVLVVAPALNSRLRRWVSDEDRARRHAAERLRAYLDQLEKRGVHAEGRVGDADPLLAIADALVTFPADEIVIAADAVPLAEHLARRARKRFCVPASRAWEPMPVAA
jgi:siroheme synthase (precorrin-2 oxidase/ferrochelatase)